MTAGATRSALVTAGPGRHCTVGGRDLRGCHLFCAMIITRRGIGGVIITETGGHVAFYVRSSFIWIWSGLLNQWCFAATDIALAKLSHCRCQFLPTPSDVRLGLDVRIMLPFQNLSSRFIFYVRHVSSMPVSVSRVFHLIDVSVGKISEESD